MKTTFNPTHISLIATLFAIAAIGCATTSSEKQLEEEQKAVSTHLKIFDDLDYRVYSHQQWNDLHLSHLSDIKVHWPDGHVTNGTEKHIEDLKAMFVWAPDTRIEEHPVKLGQKDWTAVIGVMQGTFTRAMPIGEGRHIQPTGKAYKLKMATVGHWKNGVMDEEFLFWDNQEFMKQIGLGK